MKDKRVYSGENRSGICKCGHSWEDHHTNVVLNEKYYKETEECYFPEECEYYGCNEYGGLDEDGNDHCHKYVDGKA